jgi:hypothetical protein
MVQSLQLTTLLTEFPTCEIRSLAIHDSAQLDAMGRVMVGRELGSVLWDQERGPVADLCVLVEVEALEPRSQVELSLAVMAGEGRYDLAGASVSFQLMRRRALVVFELTDLDLGPEFWDGAKGNSELLFRVRPNRMAASFDKCLRVVPGKPVEGHERALPGGQGRQAVWCRQENPLIRYRRSRF